VWQHGHTEIVDVLVCGCGPGFESSFFDQNHLAQICCTRRGANHGDRVDFLNLILPVLIKEILEQLPSEYNYRDDDLDDLLNLSHTTSAGLVSRAGNGFRGGERSLDRRRWGRRITALSVFVIRYCHSMSNPIPRKKFRWELESHLNRDRDRSITNFIGNRNIADGNSGNALFR
jgi:hypothetical protein